MAVAHSMLIAICHVLKEGVPFRDLGADYYDGFRREHKIRSCLKRLQALGWEPELPLTPPEMRDDPCPARKSAAGSSAAPCWRLVFIIKK